ncbi:MAG: hypothetical protein WAK20_04935 [Candidatus Acidiferrum sp.]
MEKKTMRGAGYFATILNAGMQQLDITIRELSKQLRISHEHAWKLQTGESLPSSLLVERAAQVVGVPVEKLQFAVDHDRKTGQSISEAKHPPHARRVRGRNQKKDKRVARISSER